MGFLIGNPLVTPVSRKVSPIHPHFLSPRKKVGDFCAKGEILAVIETDKVPGLPVVSFKGGVEGGGVGM